MLTYVEISRSAIEHNLQEFRNLVGPSTLIIPVVKSNAYGHGILEIAKICDENENVDRLAVVSLDEALSLRIAGIEKPIFILSFFERDHAKVLEAIKKNIIFPLYTLEQAKFLNYLAEKAGLKCSVHLKIDTGTSRIGILRDQIDEFGTELSNMRALNIEGLWSHFSSSEEDPKTTKSQYEALLEAESKLKKFNFPIKVKHIACSAGAALHKFSHLDGIRLGLSLYGLYPAKKTVRVVNLEPALRWKTTIIQVKNIKKGTKIGYGGTYTFKKPGKIAILPIGYFDGYDRAWSNAAEVLIGGKRCKVRGRICMNLTMVDVSKNKNCKAGDCVTLIGRDGKDEITVDELTKLTSDTINYEITTHINPLIVRNVI